MADLMLVKIGSILITVRSVKRAKGLGTRAFEFRGSYLNYAIVVEELERCLHSAYVEPSAWLIVWARARLDQGIDKSPRQIKREG